MNNIRIQTALSQIVREIPYHAAAQNANQQIDQRILFLHNQHTVRFGQTRPWLADEQGVVNSPYLMRIMKWLAISVLLLGISLGSIHFTQNILPLVIKETPSTSCPSLIIKEEKKCDCSNAVVKNKLDMIINDQSILSMGYDEPDIQEMFKDTTAADHGDNATCVIYDIFINGFTKLCSLKDNIKSIIPKKITNDFYSIGDDNEKAGRISSIADAPSTNLQTSEELNKEDAP